MAGIIATPPSVRVVGAAAAGGTVPGIVAHLATGVAPEVGGLVGGAFVVFMAGAAAHAAAGLGGACVEAGRGGAEGLEVAVATAAGAWRGGAVGPTVGAGAARRAWNRSHDRGRRLRGS